VKRRRGTRGSVLTPTKSKKRGTARKTKFREMRGGGEYVGRSQMVTALVDGG
jgi:hypothetical protein